MSKKNLLRNVLFLLLLSVLASCSNTDEVDIKQAAVKLVDSKMWSLIDIESGDIIYEDEFKNEPSAIVNGVFYVQNENGTYDYYDISDVKKPINKESYKEVTIFNKDGKALAVKQGGTIEIINTDCKTLVDLGKEVKSCSLFENGTASFLSTSGMRGIINDEGKVIVKPKYDIATNFSEDGLAIVGIEEKDGEYKYSVINKDSKVIYSFTSKDYDECLCYNEGALPVRKADGSKDIIFLDKKGKKIEKFGTDASGYSIYVYGFKDGITRFCEGDLYGLKDEKANIQIRAKYDGLVIENKNLIVAEKGEKYGVINSKDEIILPFEYERLLYLGNDRYISGSSKSASLIDSQGKDVGTRNFSDISLGGSTSVESNYYDAKSEVAKVMNLFNDNSCHNIKAGQTLSSFTHLLKFSEYYYKGESTLDETDGEFSYLYGFNKNISHETYDYLYGYRFYDGTKFDYTAQCVAIAITFSVKDYDTTAEEQFVKEFEYQLKSAGYKACPEKYFFKNKNGYCVGAGYDDGNIVIWYIFRDYNLVNITRNPRKKVESTIIDNGDYESAVDTTAADTTTIESVY